MDTIPSISRVQINFYRSIKTRYSISLDILSEEILDYELKAWEKYQAGGAYDAGWGHTTAGYQSMSFSKTSSQYTIQKQAN